MSWPVLVFDIESIPDVAGLRLLRNSVPDASDEQVYAGWFQERKEKGQSDFMPLHLQTAYGYLISAARCLSWPPRRSPVSGEHTSK